jgi:hypothetical protein
MSSVQIYTNTSSAHFATKTASPNGAKLTAALLSATPGSHLPQATKPDATAFANSLFTGSSLNYLRVKMLTTAAATLPGVVTFHVYGWSRELSTGWWEARKLVTLTPSSTACGTTNTVVWPGVGTVREIFNYGTNTPPVTPVAGDARVYTGDAAGGGGFFLVDTIGTELIEFHITQGSGASAAEFAVLCAGL